MENRYLYRGKRSDNGEWVEGLPSCDEDGEIEEIEVWDGEDIAFYPVFPGTFCQCTGYRGIYEKDIFQCDDERYVIEWCDYSLCWEAQAIGRSESISLGEFRPDEIIAIGNAIDNPELLEVQP